ncbi:MAG: hypothetical protein ACSHYB_05540 [Roseibacillus sp.]
MEKLFLIDAIAPFFRGYLKRRINWSKIPFDHLKADGLEAEAQWEMIERESEHFARRVGELGYNAVTLDDLAHLSVHHWFEEEVRKRNGRLGERVRRVMRFHLDRGLRVFVTSDVICTSAAIDERVGNSREAIEEWYGEMIRGFFEDFPEVSGLVLRIGESDGLDVKDAIRSRLHVRTARDARVLLQRLLPLFEELGKTLILRTWTVGAHPIGDLIWHRDRVAQVVKGVRSNALILSFKHGDSDFFRYLPLSEVLAKTKQAKIIEFQGRREYEGAGEYPSFIGWDCEEFQRELAGDESLVGFSMWCQTGGWHGFRRRPFVSEQATDEEVWIVLNCVSAIGSFRHGWTSEESIRLYMGDLRAEAAIKLLRLSETVIRRLLYIPSFACKEMFFRRVRVPPLFHVYWDCIFCTSSVRKLMRYFVPDHEAALRDAGEILPLFDEMKALAREAELPVGDIEFMQDTFEVMALVRRYYFQEWNPETVNAIKVVKAEYKEKWPRSERSRYRIKIDFEPFRLKRRTIGFVSSVLLRERRGYRLLDHLVVLSLLSFAYRLVGRHGEKALPKFVRKSAMGIESVMR